MDASVSVAVSLHFVDQISPRNWEEGRGRPAVRLARLQQFFVQLDLVVVPQPSVGSMEGGSQMNQVQLGVGGPRELAES